MFKKKLTLHIGGHKTGSTAIQAALAKNKDRLLEVGVNFFNLKPDGTIIDSGNCTEFWFSQNSHLQQYKAKGLGVKFREQLALMLNDCGDNVLMSAEHFSWIFDVRELIQLESEFRKYFSEIKIIIYIRRQDRHIISHHQQGSKLNCLAASHYYGNSPTSFPEHDGKEYLDYYKKLSLWGDVFGDRNIAIRVFEKELLLKGDVVHDFCSSLGLPFLEGGYENISNGFIQQKVGHLINQQLELNDFSRKIRRQLGSSGKMLPSRKQAESLYEKYVESNKKLNQRFGVSDIPDIFNHDFSFYPEERQDLWTEELANKAILNIFDSLSDFNNLSADDYRDAAIAMENKNFELSVKFMKIAHSLRPNGQFILQKLEEYDKGMRSKRYKLKQYIKKLNS